MSAYETIYARLQTILVEMFELERDKVTPGAHLYDDLGIDSIDAVDLIVRLRDEIGQKVAPETFKEIRTVDDVVRALEALTAAS